MKNIEKDLGLEKPFSSSEWLSETVAQKGLKVQYITTFARRRSFKDICQKVREHLNDIIVDGSVDFKKEKNSDLEEEYSNENIWLERQHQAVIGDQQAMSYFITKINEVLQKDTSFAASYGKGTGYNAGDSDVESGGEDDAVNRYSTSPTMTALSFIPVMPPKSAVSTRVTFGRLNVCR